MTENRHRHFTRWPDVEGYCLGQSFLPGERVPVAVAARCRSFTVEVTRVGARRETVWRRTGVRADDHPVPDEAWAHGCDWPVAVEIDTDPMWRSGFYEIRFEAEGVAEGPTSASEAFFVLRPPAGSDGIGDRPLLVLSTTTWQAYNQWGGRCFYSGATEVSFRRPLERGYVRRPAAPWQVDYDGRVASIEPEPEPEHRRLQAYLADTDHPLWCASSGWHNWERRFVQWAEGAGFELDYAVDADLDDPTTAATVLDSRRLLVTVGHSEYWSWGMRDTVDRWVGAGGNWAIFSGNTCFWQVRFSSDETSVVCFKGRARVDDPVIATDQDERLTSMWSDPLIGRPETSTIGLTFTRGGYHRVGQAVADGPGGFTVHRPNHWALADTGLQVHDVIGADAVIVGYEVDGCAIETVDGRPRPTGVDGAPTDLEIIATAPARLISITDELCEAPEALWASTDPPGDLEGTAMILFGRSWRERIGELEQGTAVLGSFTRGRGTVFNAGTTDWAYGLDTDPTVQTITANVLRHLLGRG